MSEFKKICDRCGKKKSIFEFRCKPYSQERFNQCKTCDCEVRSERQKEKLEREERRKAALSVSTNRILTARWVGGAR